MPLSGRVSDLLRRSIDPSFDGTARMSFRLAATALVLTLGGIVPALAGTSSAVPEPSTLMLFGLGVVGVIVGRRGGHKPRD